MEEPARTEDAFDGAFDPILGVAATLAILIVAVSSNLSSPEPGAPGGPEYLAEAVGAIARATVCATAVPSQHGVQNPENVDTHQPSEASAPPYFPIPSSASLNSFSRIPALGPSNLSLRKYSSL